MARRKRGFLRHHSLSIVSAGILLLWIVLYKFSNPQTHIGAFYGNAVADWTGMLLTVVGTKYLYEKGSAETRRPTHEPFNLFLRFLLDHSMVIFLIITGAAWTVLYVHMDSNAKWGQVVGNIISEWTQLFGVVVLTKKLVEQHSKESHRG